MAVPEMTDGPKSSAGRVKSCIEAFIPPLLVYFFGVGGLMYFEGWPFLTSNYVVTQIITTIGYGDFTVAETEAKIFMAFYAMACLVVLAYYHSLLVGNLVTWECEALRKYLRKYQIDSYDDIKTEEQARRKFGLANEAIAAFVVFVPALAFGTFYYRFQEHCSCSYGLQMKVGCIDKTYAECVSSGGYVKDWASAFYMSAITLTTIGFGDYQPRTQLGRVIGILWMIVGTVCTATCLGAISTWLFTSNVEAQFNAADVVDGIDAKTFSQMDINKDGSLTRGEFLAYTLVKYNLIDKELMDEINLQYDKIDVDKKNAVTLEMIQRRTEQRRRKSQEEAEDAPLLQRPFRLYSA